MGNDGGSIPKRRELVKEAARLPTTSELKATALESLAHAWSTCPVSSRPLDPQNTVADARGRLYNYETILRCLLPSSNTQGDGEEANDDDGNDDDDDDDDNNKHPEGQTQEAAEFARSGIGSLRDVVKLKFTTRRRGPRRENGGGGGIGSGGGGGESRPERDGDDEVRICPLSLKELGPGARAVYLVPCGHVFAETAMRELLAAETASANADTSRGGSSSSSSSSTCTQCGEAFALRDMVPVLPETAADVARCATRIEELRALGLTHNLKKDKSAGGKSKKRKAAAAAGQGEGDGGTNREKEREKEKEKGKERRKKKQKSDRGDDISSRINNSVTATLTAKVLAEQDERNRQRKLAAAAAAR